MGRQVDEGREEEQETLKGGLTTISSGALSVSCHEPFGVKELWRDAMTLKGTVINGQIVLDEPQLLPEGASVRVEIQQLRESRDEWERVLRSVATDCGVSLSDEALSREGMYE